jgi:beta-D-xylosidase 4
MLLAKTWHLATLASLLLPASAQPNYPDCTAGPLSQLPICDPSLPAHVRAQSLVATLTLDEKINSTGPAIGGSPRLNLPLYVWWNEALHGVADGFGVSFADSGEFSYATSFPAPIVLGATFNDALVRRVAEIISTEARAFANSGRAGLNYWTPNVNPFKDPRWGRGQETPGEDPLHCSRYAVEFVRGLQGGVPGADAEERPKVIATCKHFAAYDLEDWGGVSRYEFNAEVDIEDLLDYYLPPFKACAVDANVAGFMCSYNALNGVPACANRYLLQTVLREHWGWGQAPGHYITADCTAVERLEQDHHYVNSSAEAAAAALNAGVDLDCRPSFTSYVGEALQQGLVSNHTLDRALTRAFTALVQLGYFDSPDDQPLRAIGWDSVSTSTAEAVARHVATQGTVLLKNIHGTLPLKPNGTLALIGPYINLTTELQSNYIGRAKYIPTMIEAARELGYTVLSAQGTGINSTSTAGFEEAMYMAAKADAIIFFGGIDNTLEGETIDRTRIDWPGNQQELILALGKTGKAVTVVQFGGGQVDDSQLLAANSVSALIWAGYPSQSGGAGVFDILTGKVAPAGRLPITQYPTRYVDEVPMTDMSLRPGTHSVGRTYRWYDDAVLPFGFGLHYTTFSISWAKPHFGSYDAASLVKGVRPESNLVGTFPLAVTNTGDVPSDYVALAFVSAPNAGPQPAPIKTLVGYGRAAHIKPGETRRVDIEVTVAAIARGREDGSVVLYPGKYTLRVDVNDEYPTAGFKIHGKPQVIERFPLPGNSTI